MISNYEVWYIHDKEHTDKYFCIATFHFRLEAEKYIETFHPTDKEYYHIKENKLTPAEVSGRDYKTE